MTERENNPDLTVLIPTYNRAEILRETLEAMCKVERDGLVAEFVIIDNNSSDNTKEVVESFTFRLPIRYLFEPRPGKNCALNKALNEVKLGEIVVFTDDDVTPQPDWLKEIFASCKRNPEYSIGGGKSIINWWNNREPDWLPYSKTTCGLRGHNIGEKERLYPDDNCPIGPNLWIRSNLFGKGLRFEESIGPSPVKRAMGSETSFLVGLRSAGYDMVYCPYSIVKHRLQKSLSTDRGILFRAYTMGRGQAKIKFLCNPELQNSFGLLYRLKRLGALLFACLRLLIANMSFSQAKRIGRSIEPISDIAYNLEILKGYDINHK